jgi:hypothetical protein
LSALHRQIQQVFAEDETMVKRVSLRAKQAAPGINKAQASAIATSFLRSEFLGEILEKTVMAARERPSSMWDENVVEPERVLYGKQQKVYVTLDEIHDGRCKASSWQRHGRPTKTTYENLFGPGGYNRCIGREGHTNPTHKDEWGHVFVQTETGGVRQIRTEESETH